MRYGCRFKGVHCNNLGLIMRSVNRPLLPFVRDEYIEIPQRAGSHLFTDKPSDRMIELEFGFIENDLQSIRLKMREIARWLYSSQMERLYFDDEPDKYYLAKVANQIDFSQQVMVAGSFNVIFRCFPYALSEDKAQQDIIQTNSQSYTVKPVGNVRTPPHLTVQNTGTTVIRGFVIENEFLNN